MISLEVTFAEALDYLDENTYLTREDAKALLKTIFQIQLQLNLGDSRFRKGDIMEVMEEARDDKSLYYYELKIPLKRVRTLAKAVMENVPTLDVEKTEKSNLEKKLTDI